MADFGTDISTFPDLDLTFTVISGPRVLGESIARRLSTPYGAFPWAPDYGLDVRQLLGAKFDPAGVDLWRARITAEVEKDERVTSAAVTLTLAPDRLSASMAINIIAADEPFRFVLTVDQVTVQLLEAAAAA